MAGKRQEGRGIADLRNTVVLMANPTAHSGKALASLDEVRNGLAPALGSGSGSALSGCCLRVEKAASAEDARRTVERSVDARALLVLGGDGAVHNVVNAMMALPADRRPMLGVLPAGTGNDYARALGLPLSAAEAAKQASRWQVRRVDVGVCNGVYFAETLSFGLDAAIALDTVERRRRTGKTGAGVFVASGIDQLLHHLREYAYSGEFDGRAVQGRSITFAVQVGQYYGGGFRICPNARMDDGAFDVCVSHPPAGPLRAVEVFLRAKNAHHTRSKRISFDRAAHIHLRFDPEPAVQADGEPLHGTEFDVSTVPGALRVLAPVV